MNNLGYLYENKKKYPEAERYYFMAIEKGNPSAMNNLGCYYYNMGMTSARLTVKYLLMAVEHGNSVAMNNLTKFFREQGHMERLHSLLNNIKRKNILKENEVEYKVENKL